MMDDKYTRDNVKKKQLYINSLRMELEGIDDQFLDEVLKGQLQKLISNISYSDPMSHEELLQLEGELFNTVDELKEAVRFGDFSLAASLITQANSLLDERNRKCKLMK